MNRILRHTCIALAELAVQDAKEWPSRLLEARKTNGTCKPLSGSTLQIKRWCVLVLLLKFMHGVTDSFVQIAELDPNDLADLADMHKKRQQERRRVPTTAAEEKA